MATALTNRERAHLKARAHALEPVLHVGNAGLTDALVAEVDRALTAHELIKVKVGTDDRANRVAIGDEICARTWRDAGAPGREGHHPLAAASERPYGLVRNGPPSQEITRGSGYSNRWAIAVEQPVLYNVPSDL